VSRPDTGGGRRRWGKAGVPLTPAEARAASARAARSRRLDAENERIAHRLWREGLLVPAQITFALDLAGLHGPDVDVACGANEPDVDLWEAGKLHPTWEQMQALAALTEQPIRRFFTRPTPLSVGETSMRFHRPPDPEREAPPILRCPDAVVAECPGTVLHSRRSVQPTPGEPR